MARRFSNEDDPSFVITKSSSSDSANTIIERERRRLHQHHTQQDVGGAIITRPPGLLCFSCGLDPNLILEPHVPSTIDRVVIIGAGAIGGFVGCCLIAGDSTSSNNCTSPTGNNNSKANHHHHHHHHSYTPQVTFLVRNHQDVERYACTGLTAFSTVDPDFRASVSPSEARKIFTNDPSCLQDNPSIVFVATKRTSNATIHKWLCQYNVTCPVVFLQAGIHVREELMAAGSMLGSNYALGKQQDLKYQVIESVIRMNVDLNHETGIVTLGQAVKETLIVLDGKQQSAQVVCDLFQDSALNVRLELEHDFVSLQAANLQLNLVNAISALNGKTVAVTLRDYDYRIILAYCMEECRAVFAAHNIPLRAVGTESSLQLQMMPTLLRSWNVVFWPVMGSVLDLLPKRCSLAIDLEECVRHTEIEYLNGAVFRLGQLAGVHTPINYKLTELVQRAEALRMGCPNMGPLRLLTEVGLASADIPKTSRRESGVPVPELLSFDSLRVNETASSITDPDNSTVFSNSDGSSYSLPDKEKSTLALTVLSAENTDLEFLPSSPPESSIKSPVTEPIASPTVAGEATSPETPENNENETDVRVTFSPNGGVKLWT